MIHANFQRIDPIGDPKAERLLDSGFVQHGVGRAFDRTGEFVAVAGLDVARRIPGQCSNRLRKVEPRANPFVRVVVDTAFGILLRRVTGRIIGKDRPDRLRQIIGIGRRAGLIEYDLQLRFGRCQAEHRLDEVPPEFGVEPRRTQNDMLAARSENMLFPFEFGPSVDAGGCSLLLFPAGRIVGIAAEDIVRRDVDQQPVHLLHGAGQIPGCFGIQHPAEDFVALRLVDIRIGGAVDHAVDALLPDDTTDRLQIGDIQDGCRKPFGLDDIRKEKFVIRIPADDTHLTSQLSVGPRYENFHGLVEFFVVIEEPLGIAQAAVMAILLREEDLVGRDPPVDRQIGVVPGQRTFRLRGIEVVALVLEDHLIGQDAESVRKTARDEELAMILFGQFHGDMLAEGGRAAADVHRHIQHGTLDHADEFRLCMGRFLEMQPAEHAVGRLALVVLDENRVADLLLKIAQRERFEEVAAFIAEDAGFDDHHTFDICLDYFHFL